MQELSARADFGWRVSDLAERCEIPLTTVHRLLAALVKSRIAEQRPGDRRYFAGPFLFELALSQRGLGAFQQACEAPLKRVARRYQGRAMIFLRSGNDFVCCAQAGTSTIKAITTWVGRRRPLIVAVGGATILVGMAEQERQVVIQENLTRLEHEGPERIKTYRTLLSASLRAGYGVHNDGVILPQITSYGVPLYRAGAVYASLCIATLTEAIAGKAAPHQLIGYLKQEAAILEPLLNV